MSLALDGVEAKIGRAEEHARVLKDEILAWFQSEPYRLVPQVNSDSTRHGLRLEVTREPDLFRWALILGDAIHSLRSSLDHLIFAISSHELQGEPSAKLSKQLMFVIKDAPNDFRSAFWHIESLSPGVRAAIESVQPYNRPHEKLPPLLALLRDMDDSDKHRLLTVLFSQAAKGDFRNYRNIPNGAPIRCELYKLALKHGTEVCAVVVDRPAPDVTYDFKMRAAIVVQHAVGPNGNDKTGVHSLLQSFLIPEVREVTRIVLGSVQ